MEPRPDLASARTGLVYSWLVGPLLRTSPNYNMPPLLRTSPNSLYTHDLISLLSYCSYRFSGCVCLCLCLCLCRYPNPN